MFLLIDKPQGITSHDVVDRIRRITSERRVGHGGTLDPFATGLLLVGVGRQSTKRLWETKDLKKEYEAVIVLGEERDTDDIEGKIISVDKANKKVAKKQVIEVLKSFEGEIAQVPPIYSAVKVEGKKSYEAARKGDSLKLKPRKVMVYSIELLEFNYAQMSIKCLVSSGTYIRALARDIGKNLGVGAYAKSLRRTKIGKWGISNSVKLAQLNQHNWKSFTFI